MRRLGVVAWAGLCIGTVAHAGPAEEPSAPAGWQYAWRALRAQVPLPAAPSLVAYVADADANGIRGYEVDAETGILTPLRAAIPPTQEYPFFVAAHPSGRFVYVANLRSNSLSGFAVDQETGALQPLERPTIDTGALPWAIAMHPSGRFAYVLNAGSRSISAYAVDTTTGALQAAALQTGLESVPQAIAVAPDGRFVYVATAGRNELAGFAVDAGTGLLRRIPEVAAGLAGTPESIAVDGERRTLHVLLSSGESVAYDVDLAQGHLSPGARSADAPSRSDQAAPAGIGLRPGSTALAQVCAHASSGLRGVAADPAGRYAFAVRDDAHAILTYRIGKASGGCTAAVQSTTDAGSRPLAIVVVPLTRPAAPAS